ncbi:siderophore-interacting protein [Agrobacterium vitis]|nr:siderophore-interacting protein [Allorhizobium ampelinum]MVA46031.1 siderophore-interacting protein [Agrobacterium vitis]
MDTTTYLGIEADLGLQMFRARAIEGSRPHETVSDGLIIHLPWGDVQAVKVKSGLRLTLRANNRERLFLLQEVVDKRLDQAGIELDRRWSLNDLGGSPPNLAFTEVDVVTRLSPSYYRVRLRGTDLSRFFRDGLHFRILFGPDSHRGEWPAIGSTGRIEWPGGIASWHRPVYTARVIDSLRGTMEFDIFSHEGGRVTEWCRALRQGDDVAIMGPSGEWYPHAKWLALFGDETALPAIARILEERPAGSVGSATILVSDKGDIQDLKKPGQVEVNWLVRGGSRSLIDAVLELDIPQTDRFVWFAGERSECNSVRRVLLERGVDKSEMRTASYWSR